jgi:hypothetical protein
VLPIELMNRRTRAPLARCTTGMTVVLVVSLSLVLAIIARLVTDDAPVAVAPASGPPLSVVGAAPAPTATGPLVARFHPVVSPPPIVAKRAKAAPKDVAYVVGMRLKARR